MLTPAGALMLIGIFNIAVIALAFISFVCGVTVACMRKRGTSPWGVCMAIDGIYTAWTVLATILLRKYGSSFAVAQGYINLAMVLLSVIALVMIFVYARSSYGSRGLLFVVIAPVVWWFVVNLIRAKMVSPATGIKTEMMVVVSRIALELVIVGILVYIVSVYMRNRAQESLLRPAFIWIILFVIREIATAVIYCLAVYDMIPELIYFAAMFVIALIGPYVAVHLLVLVFKGRRETSKTV